MPKGINPLRKEQDYNRVKAELLGKKFNLLTVIEVVAPQKKKNQFCSMVLCQCDCGNRKIIRATFVKNGDTRSCGCLSVPPPTYKHGQSSKLNQTPEHKTWCRIKQRCYNHKKDGYERYGGRGIKVCQRWLDDFQNFFDDMGEMPSPNHSLDRFPNNDGDYEPINCRWATPKEQANNTSTNRYVEHCGERLTIAQWADKLGIPYRILYKRINNGKMTTEQAFRNLNYSTAKGLDRLPSQLCVSKKP